MKIYGTVSILDVEYYYELHTSTVRSMWKLYRKETLSYDEYGVETISKFPVFELGQTNIKHLPFLETALVHSSNKDIYQYYGNIRILETIIDEYNKALSYSYGDRALSSVSSFNTEFTASTEDGSYSIKQNKYNGCVRNLNVKTPACTITTMAADTSTSTSFQTPKWINLTQSVLENAGGLRSAVSALQYRTLAELRTIKDLSWYIDSNGKKLKNYVVVDSVELFDKYLTQIFPKIKIAAVDIESDGLDFYKTDDESWLSHMVGFGISWARGQGIYIPLRHKSVDNIPWDYCLEKMKPFLESWDIITHNGLFDGRVFYHYKINLNIKYDTMQMGFLINPNVQKGSKALKQMTLRRYGHETLELKDIFKSRKDVTLFEYLPKNLIEIYACADVDYTFTLCQDMIKEMEPQLMKPFRLDMSLFGELIKSEYNGNAVNVDLLMRFSEAEYEDMKKLTNMIYSYVGKVILMENVMYEYATVQRKSDEEVAKIMSELQQSKEYKEAKYEFKLGGNPLVEVLYDILKYPMLRFTSKGAPSVDKWAIEDLQMAKWEEPQNWLTEDIISSVASMEDIVISDKEKILVSASEFNSCKYPIAYLLSKYNKLNKRKNSFFDPVKKDNKGGRYYSSNSLTAAETSRIINKIQILPGYLKRLVCTYDSNEYYMIVFDYAQIEYRVMSGIAKQLRLVERLRNSRADYHREGGAPLVGTTPQKMTTKQRKNIKAVNFAVPYGMGARSLASNVYNTRTPNRKQIEDAELLLTKWYLTNHEIKAMLDEYREFALQNGYVRNQYGRKRVLDLTKLNKGQVERMAGNYPIQSFAAELFKIGFKKFRDRLNKEGLGDKVITTALVHDEMVNIVHKSVNPYKMYEIIVEECMLELEGHPPYYAGISVCSDWYEGKADLYEAPIEYVQWAVEEYKAGRKNYDWVENPRDLVLNDIKEFMPHLFFDEFKMFQEDISKDNVRFDLILPKFDDYFLIPAMEKYFSPNTELAKGCSDDDKTISYLETILLNYFGEPFTATYMDGRIGIVSRNSVEVFDKLVVMSESDLELDFMLESELLLSDSSFSDDVFDYNEIEYSESIFSSGGYDVYNESEDLLYEKNLVVSMKLENGNTITNYSDSGDAIKLYDANDFFRLTYDGNKVIINISGRTERSYIQAISSYINGKLCEESDLGAYKVVFFYDNKFKELDSYIRNFDQFEIAKILDKNVNVEELGVTMSAYKGC